MTRQDHTGTRHPRLLLATATALAAAVIGVAAGAAIYATTDSRATVTGASAAATAVSQTTAELTVSEIYRNDAAGVVEVDVTTTSQDPYGGPGTSQTEQAQGTGFVYDKEGDIVTNQHVVDGASSITVKFSDGSTYRATVVGADASTDVAVIKVDAPASKLHPLTLADSSTVSVGDGVVAIGDPFGLDLSVTTGIVSAVGREITSPDGTPIEDAIQTDAAVNHGNSGGPLLNMRGEVIGLVSQIESSSGGSDGVGFAVPSNTISSVASRLIGA